LRRTILRYGRGRANIAELWWPRRGDGDLPAVVLIHGGFWRAPYTKRLMHRLARAVTAEGWAAWNIEYRRVGRLGGEGGWPGTFVDVAAAVDALARVRGIDPARVVTCGHSAGGHLALWAAARARLPPDAPGAGPRLALTGAVSLAGVVDLRRAAATGIGGDAVTRLMGGPPDTRTDRYSVASPADLLPLGVRQVLVHGLDDGTVPAWISERYQADALAAGDTDVAYLPIAGAGHMEMINPRSAAWPAVRDSLRSLLA
jgi:acetyl esterase/lipase